MTAARTAVTTERLGGLLDAVVALSSDLSLESLLERIVRQACLLVDAKYGALGVLGLHGDRRLTRFVTHGFTDAEIAAIGELPRGHGILGHIIDHPQPLRLQNLGHHPATFGFPSEHPAMGTFLGVPIRIHDRIFGNLYLTEKQSPGGFTREDEEVAVALASAVGVVIENARLYDEAERQRRWLEAAAEITTALLGPISRDTALQLVADRARDVADADFVALLMPTEADVLEIRAVSGAAVHELIGETVGAFGSLAGEVARTQVTAVVPDTAVESRYTAATTPLWPDLGSVLVLPLRSGDVTGALTVGWHEVLKTDRWELDPELPQRFAEQLALVLQVAQAQEDQARLAVFEDRDRIGRDLHDLVIQRLFAIGLMLDNTVRLVQAPDAMTRLSSAIDEIDATIKDIRRTIFALSANAVAADLKTSVERLLSHAALTLGFPPSLDTRGPIDSSVPEEVREHLIAVLNESISNVVRHASATKVEVLLDVGDDITLQVRDDGPGLGGQEPGSGLTNMRARAELLGGHFAAEDLADGGLELTWVVPRGRP
ncbi:sensor histidine kinase [Aeromicrobium sp.]|uniref:sensor histidine kinase n=1 Tax=Aeromicrobium sp. TaxID=1871063 RepID=UPI002FC9ACA7